MAARAIAIGMCGIVAALASSVHQADAARTAPTPPVRVAQSLSVASAYGPGLYGNRVACSRYGILQPGTVGVAHRWLPCGTRLAFLSRRGRWVPAVVIDRGPYVSGRTFDLTSALVQRLGYRDCYAFGHRSVTWRRA